MGAVGAAVVTIGTGGAAAPIIGGVAGGFVGYGAGKGNEKLAHFSLSSVLNNPE